MGRRCLWEEGWTPRRHSQRGLTLFSQSSRKYARDHIVTSLRLFFSCFFCFLGAFKIVPQAYSNHTRPIQTGSVEDGVGPWSRITGKVTGCLIGTNQATGRVEWLSRSEEKWHWPTEIGTAVGCVHAWARLHIRSTCLCSSAALVNTKRSGRVWKETEKEPRLTNFPAHIKGNRVLRITLHYSFLFFHSELLLWITEESLLRVKARGIKKSSERVLDGASRTCFRAGTNICESSISLSNY